MPERRSQHWPVHRPPWLHRHHLLWIAPAHRSRAVAEAGNAGLSATVANWLEAGWPLVVRRQPAALPRGGAEERIAVGMPLSPAAGKARIALAVCPRWVCEAAPPPLLSDAVARIAQPWRTRLGGLSALAASLGFEPRVYGSAAWEALTGERYLTSESDVDLLLRPATRAQLGAMLAGLSSWETASGMRADGEILFGDDAVAWREWAEASRKPSLAAARVLVKTISGPRLAGASELLARLPAERAETALAV